LVSGICRRWLSIWHDSSEVGAGNRGGSGGGCWGVRGEFKMGVQESEMTLPIPKEKKLEKGGERGVHYQGKRSV